jgi:HlyD family secretion protein
LVAARLLGDGSRIIKSRQADDQQVRTMNEHVHPMSARNATEAKVVVNPAAAQANKGRPLRARAGLVATVIGLVALAAGGVIYWTMGGGANVRYTEVPVTRGPVARTVTATGTVNPVLTIIVGTYVSGVIQQLYCDYNTQVKEGQICAKIDPRPYQMIVDQDKATLAVEKAQLEKDTANLAYAKLNYERNLRLVETNAVSKDAADNAKNLHDQAQAQIAFDKATIDQRQAQLDAAQINLDYTNITSPVNGTVVSRNVTMGQTVAASFQTPTLFLIATDLTTMQVDTNVSESDIGDIKEGNKATFTVDAFPKRSFEGRVSQVRQSPQNVQNVVTYDVVVSASNSDLSLKPGMTAATGIVTASRDDVIRVPNQALRYRPSIARAAPLPKLAAGQTRVWVLRDGQPAAVLVAAGLDDDSFTEIVSGDLKPGDQVITGEQTGETTSPGRPPSLPRLR